MTRRLVTLLAMVVAVSLVLVAPVGAEIAPDGTYRGTVAADFNLGFGDATTPCSGVSWSGTVDFGSEQYGLIWVSLGGGVENAFFHFGDIWILYEDYDFVSTNGVLTTCEGTESIWGVDSGAMNLSGVVQATGFVAYVDPDGPFDASLVGGALDWRGPVGESGLTFSGLFRITPP